MAKQEKEGRETEQPTRLNREEESIIEDLKNRLEPRLRIPKTWPRP